MRALRVNLVSDQCSKVALLRLRLSFGQVSSSTATSKLSVSFSACPFSILDLVLCILNVFLVHSMSLSVSRACDVPLCRLIRMRVLVIGRGPVACWPK